MNKLTGFECPYCSHDNSAWVPLSLGSNSQLHKCGTGKEDNKNGCGRLLVIHVEVSTEIGVSKVEGEQ